MIHYFRDITLHLAILSSFALGIFVLGKNPREPRHIAFFLFSFMVALWTLEVEYFLLASSYKLAYFWIHSVALTIILIGITFYHLVLTFQYDNFKHYKNKIFFSYFLTLFVIAGYFIQNFYIRKIVFHPWGKENVLGLGYYIIYFLYGLYIILAFKNLLTAYRHTKGMRHNQIKYLIYSTIFAVSWGTFFNWLLVLFGNYRFIWIGPYGTFILVVACSYAIVKYHLLEIEVVIRRTIVFTGVFTFVFGAFVGTAYLAQTFWAQITGTELLAMVIAVLIIVLVQEPLKNMLIKYTDRFFLQKKYDYQKVLRDASEGMSTVRETKWLLGLITHIVSSKMRVSNIGIFLEEDQLTTEHYFLKAKRGKETIQHTSLSKDNPISLWLKDNKKPLVLEEVDYLLQRKDGSADSSSLKNMLTRIKSQMQSLNSKVIIPAFYKGSLLGFLSLGYKLSGDMYTKEDLILLSTLSNSAAVAIENARLFDNLIDEIEINNQLRKEEEDSYMQMMMSLAKTIDAKDSYTYDHVEMVYQYGVDLTEYLPGVNKDALKASLRLHDLGKIGVPDSILSKQGPLTPEEWKKVKDHTILGARILAPLKKFEYVAKIILHHQEKFDGTGYPAGLKEEDIPLESRIIAVVDAYHAMVSDRPYRKALSKQIAIAELKKFAGTQFDPIVVEAFLKLLKAKYGITET